MPTSSKLPEGCFFQRETGESVSLGKYAGGGELLFNFAGGHSLYLPLSPEQYTRLQEAKQKATVEIEKKFLVEELPEDLGTYARTAIEQRYIIIADKDEVRIREKTKGDKKSYTLTIKSGEGVKRGEYETAITHDQYQILRGSQVGNTIDKLRFDVPHKGNTIELDIYLGELAGNATAEVEFATDADAESFQKPDWFCIDISDKNIFKNKNLALHGFPDGLYSTEFAQKMSEQVGSILKK